MPNTIICHECGKKVSGLVEMIRNSRGHGVAVCCESCAVKVQGLVDRLAGLYAWIPGKASPYGTPDVRSVEALKAAIVERENR